MQSLNLRLDSLVIFRNLLKSPVIIKLKDMIMQIGKSGKAVTHYAGFISELYRNYDNFSEFLLDSVLEDDNFYIKAKATGEKIDPIIETALANELDVLQELSLIRPSELKSLIRFDGFLPEWKTKEFDFFTIYQERIENISRFGFGMFSKYHVFAISGDEIVPVKYPDPISLYDFECYDEQREPIVKNTQALLKNGPASNILLYGDAGTGKSSTVKAIVNHYCGKGLRLVEVKKHQLNLLTEILEKLADNPLKFIIYIDDLSFTQNDDNFTELKATLEGSSSDKGKNVVIYATSNRRHLIKEHFSDRVGDELHVNDSLQEMTGLAARFGLTVTFDKPNKDVYLQIVKRLALEYDIMADEQLLKKAEAFAIRNNGRSPRTARQFIELTKSEVY